MLNLITPPRELYTPLYKFRVLGGALLLLSATSISAAQQPPARGERPGPPAEAFTACENLASGDVCSVVLPNQTLSGTCGAPRGPKGRGSENQSRPANDANQSLLCIPQGHKPPPRGGEREEGQTPPSND